MTTATRSEPKQSREALEKIAESFRVLSEPTRLAILQELQSGSKTVNELVDSIGTSQPNVSKQLKMLFDAGFVLREQRGNFVYYQMQGDFVLQLCDLVCARLNRRAQGATRHYSI